MVDPALQIGKQGADQSPDSADKEFEAKYTNDSVCAVVHAVSRGTRRSRQGIHTRRRQLRSRFGLVYRWRTAALSEYQADILEILRHWITQWVSGKSLGRLGWAFADFLNNDVSYSTAVLLCMGLDRSNGVMSLDRNHQLTIDWAFKDSMSLSQAILNGGKEFAHTLGSRLFILLPTWNRQIRNNVTVHALGGCVLADDSSHGVTNADRRAFGEVFGYEHLYVADGAIVPTSVGANPTATILALSEMVAEGITGIVPTSDL
jgi:choline dehydrogenase-like flavoprotein